MPSPSPADVLALDLPFRPYELLAAWRPASRSLAVVVQQPVRQGQPVQARISVLGLGVSATITGRAARVREHPVGYEVELAPDDTRVRALERLAEVASGERVDYKVRAPRYLAEVPAVVHGARGPTLMSTFAVSENGCGLAWSGPMPEVGVPMDIRLEAGDRMASFCGEVRWTATAGRVPTVGVQFAAGDRKVWAQIIAALKAAGAPPA
jgi:hypothetical protein